MMAAGDEYPAYRPARPPRSSRPRTVGEHGVGSPVEGAGYLSTPPLCGASLPLDGARTLPEAFARSVARFADGVALRTVSSDRVYTWREYGKLVAAYAGGFAGLGVRRGEVVGLMLANRPEFFVVDTAAQHLGATPYSVYNTSSPEPGDGHRAPVPAHGARGDALGWSCRTSCCDRRS